MIRVIITALLLGFGLIALSQSQPISIVTTTKAGDWNDNTCWVRHQIPSANDDVILRHNMFMSQGASCTSINLNGHNLTVNSNVAVNVTGSGPTDVTETHLFLFNKSNSTTPQLVAQYSIPAYNLDFYLYGTWNGDTINKVTSVSVRKKTVLDTTLNFILNDSLAVTHYYMDVAGVKDTALFRINYQTTDSLFVVYQLYTNWQNTVLLRSIHSVFIGHDTSYMANRQTNGMGLRLACNGSDNVANQAIRNALVGLMGMGLIYMGVVVSMPALLAAAYIAAGFGIYVGSQGNTLQHIEDAIGGILSQIPCANADDTPPRQDDLTPNPIPPLGAITPQSPYLFGCPCSWNFGVITDERAVNNLPPSVDSYTYSAVPHSNGYPPGGPIVSGVTFVIGKGTTFTHTIFLQYYLEWPPNPNGQSPWTTLPITRTFACH